MTTRRDFIKTAGALTLGGLLTSETLMAASKRSVGIQLYTLRDELPKDPKGVLKKIAAAGYQELESYQGEQGVFFGMKAKEFKKFIGDLGMNLRSSHVGTGATFEKTVAELAEAGAKYVMSPYNKQNTLDEYKKTGEDFVRLGEIARKNGLQFGYHNHAYAFTEVEGVVPYDMWLKEIDPKLMVMEMDIYWVVRAGKDPVDYFNQYPGRFPLWHVKDMDKGDEDKNTEIGKGKIDFKALLKHASKAGLKYAFVEQESNYAPNPFGSIKTSASYLKGIQY
jgi:sugar phosphate isomerase/epimerase